MRNTRRKKVSGSATNVEYNYDGAGRRVQKATGGTTTRYAYDGLKVAIEQVGASAPTLYMNDSSPVGGMLASYDQSDEANALVYAYDVIGNVVGYLDQADLTTSYGDGTSFVQSRHRRDSATWKAAPRPASI